MNRAGFLKRAGLVFGALVVGRVPLAVSEPDPDIFAFGDGGKAAARMAGAPLIASGGLCAPVSPYYNLEFVSTASGLIANALPGFNADRGGLRYSIPA